MRQDNIHSDPMAASAPTLLDRIRRVDARVVAAGLGIAAAAIIVVATLIAVLVADAMDSARVADDIPALVQSFAFFFGFLAAGVYVGRRAVHDRMLHAVALVFAGFALVAVVSILDLASGLPLESLMPGGDAENAARIHIGFWVVAWVAVPAASLLGASIVPRGSQGWGTVTSEPEDTEL